MNGTPLLAAILCLQPAALAAQQLSTGGHELRSGKAIYMNACAACHGADGKGASKASVGFDTPLPDFSDCNFASREPNADWGAVVHEGGPARGFSPIMPAFGGALTPGQIEDVLDYIRGFCESRAWPRGELNLPRPLVTEKAFPEDETVLTGAFNLSETPAVTQKITYEKRFGARNQVEVAVPFTFKESATSWVGGVGDLALAYKRALFHSLRKGSIFSVTGEAVLPTGDKNRGFGEGVTIFETFATYGQILPSDSFVQFQGGFEFPTRGIVSRAAFWRTALGRSFSQGGGFGRTWSPMVELLASRAFETGAKINWDIVPQMQVTLNTRQHIMANFGVRVPATNTTRRPVQFMFYLLWDWFDGGFREGW